MSCCEYKTIELDDYEFRVMVDALARRRNDLIKQSLPTEDVSNLILKIIDSPAKASKKDRDYER